MQGCMCAGCEATHLPEGGGQQLRLLLVALVVGPWVDPAPTVQGVLQTLKAQHGVVENITQPGLQADRSGGISC